MELIVYVELIEVVRLLELFEIHESVGVTIELIAIAKYIGFVERLELLQ